MTTPTPAPTLNLKNIQGDILLGLPKKFQIYVFFEIINATLFKAALKRLIPQITTTDKVLKDVKAIADHKKKKLHGLVPVTGVNIALSHKGFVELEVDDSSLGDATDPFIRGQKVDAVSNLGDPKSPNGNNPDWDPHFLQDIHGVILISAESYKNAELKKLEILLLFELALKVVTALTGNVRPGAEAGHEHFGFLDGISQPLLQGFNTNIPPGPAPVQPGVIVTGQPGDPDLNIRTELSKDGSFNTFRYLHQAVPEFDAFLKKNPIPKDGNGKALTPAEGSDLLGARFMGRWKSGAPIDITPFQDDPVLAADPNRNNNFEFAGEITSSLKCPFAAHIRKTNPRDDLEVPPPPIASIPVAPHRIMRRGIPFGPEVTQQEEEGGKTIHERGLLFNCYQTSLVNGFQFLQQAWANNKNFPPFTKTPTGPGLDPLIGQGDRETLGVDPLKPNVDTLLPSFVTAKGGEYFYTPSMQALLSIATK